MTKIVEIRNPIIYRIKDIARELHVTKRTVRRWISDGLLKPRGYRRIGGSALELIFTADEVDRFLDVYLVRLEDINDDFDLKTPRGKEGRAAEVARILGQLRIFAGRASAAKYKRLLEGKR